MALSDFIKNTAARFRLGNPLSKTDTDERIVNYVQNKARQFGSGVSNAYRGGMDAVRKFNTAAETYGPVQMLGTRMANQAQYTADLSKQYQDTVNSGQRPSFGQMANLGINTAATLLPGVDDAVMGGYDFGKSLLANKSLRGARDSFVGDPTSGEGFTGLGDALSRGRGGTMADTLNTLELPAMLVGGSVLARKQASKQIAEATGDKKLLEFSGKYDAGDIKKIQSKIDEYLGTDSFKTSKKWQAAEAARNTARNQLEEYAKMGEAQAKAILDEVDRLEGQLDLVRGVRSGEVVMPKTEVKVGAEKIPIKLALPQPDREIRTLTDLRKAIKSGDNLETTTFKPSGVESIKKALKAGFPAKNIDTSTTLKPGKEVIQGMPPGGFAFTELSDVEKRIFGTETPGKSAFGGDKKGAGVITDALRSAQETMSAKVGLLTESENPAARNIGRLLQGFSGGLGKTQADSAAKGDLIGGGQYASKLAGEVQQYVYGLVENNKNSLRKVHAILDPDLSDGKIATSLTPGEKEAVEVLRLVSDYINDTNYRNGFVSQEKWLENRGGKYIARAYEPFEYPDEVQQFIAQASRKLQLDGFMKREGLTDWKKENAIRDPAFLVAKRLQETISNDTVKQYINYLGGSEYVTDVARAGFEKLSDAKYYGDLAGKWVRKDFMDDIKGLHFTNQVAQKFYEFSTLYDRNPVRRGFKGLFTIYNPSVQLGNVTSNFLFAWLGGINPVTFQKNKSWAGRAIDSNDQLYRQAVKSGIMGGDILLDDIGKWSQEIASEISDPGILKQINDKIVNQYGRNDDVAKLSALKTYLDRGMTFDEAARRTYNHFQNYRTVGWLYEVGAKLPVVGNPFVRFKGDLGRIVKNSVVEHPVRTAMTLAAWQFLTDQASALSGETPEDRQTREQRVGAARIPFTDMSLSVQTPFGEVNAARLLGLYAYNPVGGPELGSDISEFSPINNPLDPKNYTSDPVAGLPISLLTDQDFRGKSIADPDQSKWTGSTLTDAEKNRNRAEYVGRQVIGPFAGSVLDTVSAFKGEPDYYGRNKTPLQATLRMFPGVKLEQFNAPEAKASRGKEQYYDIKAVDAIDSQINRVAKDAQSGSITPEVARQRMQSLEAEKAKVLNNDKSVYSGIKNIFGLGESEKVPVKPASAEVYLSGNRALPKNSKQLAVLYKDAISDLDSFETNMVRAQYSDEYYFPEQRDQAIAELEQKRATAESMLNAIREQRPEQVLDIEIDVHKSGGSKNTEERAAWASEILKNASEQEYEGILKKLYDGDVLTKSVVEMLNDEYGLSLSKYISGGKLKSLGGSGGPLSKLKTSGFDFSAPGFSSIPSPGKVRVSMGPRSSGSRKSITDIAGGLPDLSRVPVRTADLPKAKRIVSS